MDLPLMLCIKENDEKIDFDVPAWFILRKKNDELENDLDLATLAISNGFRIFGADANDRSGSSTRNAPRPQTRLQSA